MEGQKHGEKLVDGIPIKYLCEPCSECRAKLEAAEGLFGALKYLADESNWDNDQDGYRLIRPGGFRQEGIFQISRNLNPWLFARDLVTAWEKAKGET